MADGILALAVAIGLVCSIVGAFKVMRSTPIMGGDADGYAAQHGAGPLEALVAQQRSGWRLIVIGFCLQCAGALGAAWVAFSRA